MKAVIFTVDAFFALIIALASVSLLLYFYYYPQNQQLTTRYSEVSSLMQTLITTNVSTVASNNLIAFQLAYQANAVNETWDEYMKNSAGVGSNIHGPPYPYISFVFQAPANIQTNIVADFGKIFFGSGTTIYALNATTGNVVWKRGTGTAVTSLAAASGVLYYANFTNLTAMNPSVNKTLWTTSAISSLTPLTTPLVIYSGQILFGSAEKIYAFYTNNGVQAWFNSTVTAPNSIVVAQGEIVTRTASGNIIGLDSVGTVAKQIFSTQYAQVNSPQIAALGGAIAFGSSTSGNVIYTDGNTFPSFPVAAGSAVNSVAVFNNTIVYQGTTTMTAVLQNGLSLWSISMPGSLGIPVLNSTPVVSNRLIYSVWTNNVLVAQNLSNGAVAWSTNIPTVNVGAVGANMSLAYGRLYLTAGKELIAYGTCNSGPTSSLLALAAFFYVNKEGSCADVLLNNAYQMGNYSIFINNSFAPSLNIASFNALNSSAIYLGNNASIMTNSYSWSFWIYPTSWPTGSTTNAIAGQTCSTAGCPFVVEQNNGTNRLVFSAGGGLFGYTTYSRIAIKNWTHVVGTYNFVNGTTSLYINGVLVSSAKNATVARRSTPMYIGRTEYKAKTYFNGSIADFQIYNSTLLQGQVLQLYRNGIQGPPVTGGLAAWYPLEGDANDYARKINTGYTLNGITFVQGNFIPIGLRSAYSVSKSSALIALNNYSSSVSTLNYTFSLPQLYNVGVASWR